MKRFRRNTSGQFVVLAALLIATLTLSLALSIHQLNLQWQQLRYEPIDELVLGITSDLDRCLTNALSVASERYYQTDAKDNATSEGYNLISKWVRSVLASYSYLGIKMNMSVPQTGTGLTDVWWELNWGKEVGLSYVYTEFDLDIDAYGFKGWVGQSGRFVMLRIFPDSIALTDSTTTLRFQIVQGKGQALPIPNLTNESLKIWAHLTRNVMVPAHVVGLSYLGGGNYTVTFTPKVNEQTLGAQLTVVTPEDKIYVSAYYYRDISQRDIYVTLQSSEQDGDSKNLGQIQLRASNYTLPTSFKIDPGKYLLRYFADEGYIFLNWTTDGFAFVDDPDSSITSVIVYDNCTLTALYENPKMVNLFLDSREKSNLTRHMGIISVGTTDYTLPANVNLDTGEYMLQFRLDDLSQYFQFWESSGGAMPASSNDNPTTLLVNGNGTVIAVYGPQPPVTTQAKVTLQSLEENLASKNLGNIIVGTAVFGLPSSTNLPNGTYLLEYIAVDGYTFVNWTTTGGISVQDRYSSVTLVRVNGNGAITAFYRGFYLGYNILLDSRHWAGLSSSLGYIKLGPTAYTLPKNLRGVAPGNYLLEYTGHNMSYVFLWWECSGGVIPWDWTSNCTSVTIFGDGTLIAVYYLISEGEPPFGGDWKTLYLDTHYRLNPPFLWSGRSGHIPPSFSIGKEKQVALLYSPSTPTIVLAPLVNVTAYIRPNPPESVKDITMELGFVYKGDYYRMGTAVYTYKEQGVYRMQIDIFREQPPFPDRFGVIPEGSVIYLTVTVTFYRSPWGTFFIYYGPDRPTNVQLYSD